MAYRSPALDHGHIYAEAFCLMLYRAVDGSEEEWIWNSRDGVTPFCVRTRDGKTEMRHAEWHRDRYAPTHVPQPGDRVFVDLTIERARAFRREFAARWWDHPEYPLRECYATMDEAVEALAKADTAQPGAPHLMVVVQPWEAN